MKDDVGSKEIAFEGKRKKWTIDAQKESKHRVEPG
jgi:hypothetical protein